jgi:putative acetyltransferase
MPPDTQSARGAHAQSRDLGRHIDAHLKLGWDLALGPMYVLVRSETPADWDKIEALTASAFLNAPHSSHAEQHIVTALRRAGQLSVSLVAEADAGLIGHVAISPVSISDGTPGWFGLGPISVLPQYQRQGIGSRLMREALRILSERGASGCVVLGEREYYGRFGFRADPDLVLPGVPAEYFQALPFGSSRPRGTVTYHEAFEARG